MLYSRSLIWHSVMLNYDTSQSLHDHHIALWPCDQINRSIKYLGSHARDILTIQGHVLAFNQGQAFSTSGSAEFCSDDIHPNGSRPVDNHGSYRFVTEMVSQVAGTVKNVSLTNK